MADDLEHTFFYRLKLITTLLIKHASHEYRDLLPLVQEHEDRRWQSLSGPHKYERIAEIAKLAGASTPLTNHFEEFPHEWSKKQYVNFLEDLKLYCGSLKDSLD